MASGRLGQVQGLTSGFIRLTQGYQIFYWVLRVEVKVTYKIPIWEEDGWYVKCKG